MCVKERLQFIEEATRLKMKFGYASMGCHLARLSLITFRDGLIAVSITVADQIEALALLAEYRF